MAHQVETSTVADVVRSIEPWVWPATAAIVVGGLIVFRTLAGGEWQVKPMALSPGDAHVSANPMVSTTENRSDARAN